MGGAREYYTKEEMETFKPKKRLKKKLRKARVAAVDDDEEGLGAGAGPSSTANAVAALEEVRRLPNCEPVFSCFGVDPTCMVACFAFVHTRDLLRCEPWWIGLPK